MSKLSSFSNKNKHRLCDVYIEKSLVIVGGFVKVVWGNTIPGSCGFIGPKGALVSHPTQFGRVGCFFNEIIFFDKEEKIIETKYDIFIISSIADEQDEQFFWMTLEENVSYYDHLCSIENWCNNEQT